MRKMVFKVLGEWVVYKMTLYNKVPGPNAVCDQEEWDKMEKDRPGYHLLIQGGIKTEGEAEKLARASPGGSLGEKVRLKQR